MTTAPRREAATVRPAPDFQPVVTNPAGDRDTRRVTLEYVSRKLVAEGILDSGAIPDQRPEPWVAAAVDDALATHGLEVAAYQAVTMALGDDVRQAVTSVSFDVTVAPRGDR